MGDGIMMPPSGHENPFTARRLMPGALPFLFPAGMTAASLLHLWRRQHRRGQIVGAHGTGKSTLLATLVPCLRDQGEQVAWVMLRDDQRQLPPAVRQQLAAARPLRPPRSSSTASSVYPGGNAPGCAGSPGAMVGAFW